MPMEEDEAYRLLSGSPSDHRSRDSRPYTRQRCPSQCRKLLAVAGSAVRRLLPPITWLPSYGWPALASDALAGLSVGLTVLPQALAYAGLAGLPPQYGLYSAFMGCFAYALFGTAKDVSVGPTAVMALLVNQFAMSPVPNDATLAIILTLGCGVIQFVLGILHLGFVVNFISYPVINSFTSAAAITIAFGEVKSLFGIDSVRRPFFESVYDTFAGLPKSNPWDAGMAVACIGLLLALGVVKKRFVEPDLQPSGSATGCRAVGHRIITRALWVLCTARNAVLLMVAAGIAATVHASGIAKSFTLTKSLERGLPPLRWPSFSINATVDNVTVHQDAGQVLQGLAVGFVVVSLIGILEQVAISQAFARINDYKVNANQEIVALGLVNFFSSLVSSYPITASFSKSAINAASGARTPAGGVWTGALVLVALAVLTPYFAYIPSSALASVIVVAVLDMVDVRIVLDLWRVRRVELLPYALTLVLSFPWGIEYGIMSGAALSLLMLLYQIARPQLMKGPGCENGNVQPNARAADVWPSAEMVQPRSGLTFPCVEHVCAELLRLGPLASPVPKDVALDCSHVSLLDYTAVHGLLAAASIFQKRGVRLHIVAASDDIRDMFARAARNSEALVFAGGSPSL